MNISFLLVVHKQSTTCRHMAFKTTLALLLFVFGMCSVVCFHMKGGLSSALLVLSCVHQRSVPNASSDPGSSSVFLKPWHRLAPGNEKGAAWRTPPGRLHSPLPTVHNGRWTKCPLSVERKSKSRHCYQFFIVTQYSFYLVNSILYMREAWLFINSVFPRLATRCQERAFTKAVHNNRVCHCVMPWIDIY